MKRAHGKYKASKAATEDGINNMPENVTSQILDCLPIKDAVRTSILSRSWRFKWRDISQLIFDEKFFAPRSDNENNWNEMAITRLLLHLKGVITKFVLYVPHYKILDLWDVNRWVMFLSQKGIREFTLKNGNIKALKLPSHLFACLDLKLLKLVNCLLRTPPDFCGFPYLLKLNLRLVGFESGNIGEFIGWCPLLEILKISYNHPSGKVTLDEITKLKNLKVLSLPLHIYDLGIEAIMSSHIYELVGSLPKLQKLYLDFQKCELADGRKLVRTLFPCLKTLALYSVDFGSSTMLSCAFGMIWRSPNLKTLKITATYKDAAIAAAPPSLVSLFVFLEQHHITMRKVQLESVMLSYLRGSEAEVRLIKYILACSPLLKNINIYVRSCEVFGGENGKAMFATNLLKLHRASSNAEVNIYWSNLDI